MKIIMSSAAAVMVLAWAEPSLAQHAGHGGGDPMREARPARHRDTPRAPGPPPGLPSGPRQVQVTITETGFEPSEVRAEAGDSVTLFITRLTEATCAKEVNFFGRGVQVALPMGQEVKVTIDVNEPGTVRFGCLSGADGAVIKVAENRRP